VERPEPIRAVIDTQQYIYALSPGSPSEQVVLAMAGRTFDVVTTDAILREAQDTLHYVRTKQPIPASYIENLLGYLQKFGHRVSPIERLRVVKEDPDDDKFIEAAVAGQARFLVTDDRHLRRLKSYRGTEIVTAKQFLSAIGQPWRRREGM